MRKMARSGDLIAGWRAFRRPAPARRRPWRSRSAGASPFGAAVERAPWNGSDARGGEHVHRGFARAGESETAAVRQHVVGALGHDGLEARLAQRGADPRALLLVP